MKTVKMFYSHRWLQVVAACVVLIICFAMLACSTNNKVNVKLTHLGKMQYTSKTLGGIFFQHEGKYYLIGGTEVFSGSHAQVFVYSLGDRKMILNKVIHPAVSILSFVKAGDTIYFATITGNKKDGCDLYSYNIKDNCINKLQHFQEQGIYAMDWDGNDSIYIATSFVPRFYKYSIKHNNTKILMEKFTNEVFVRSMRFKNEKCFLGIGSNPDLIAIDVNSLEWESLLPEELKNNKNNTFIYNINILDNHMYALLKNDMGIYSTPLDIVNFERITDYRTNTNTSEHDTLDRWIDIEGDILFLNDNGEVYQQYALDGLRSFYEEDTKLMWSLDSSCILHKYYNGVEKESIDLGEVLEKSYVIPLEFIAYDDVLYFPGRRFVVWNRNDNTRKVFILHDEPQASTVTNESLYTGIYPHCTMYEYPLETFEASGREVKLDSDNFFLAKIDNQCRPTQMDVTANGRYLVMGSGPLYGKFGGAVSVYDLKERKILYSHENVINNHSIQSVRVSCVHEGCVWLGTCPYGEGTNPYCLDEPSHLVLWDIENERIKLDIVIDEKSRKIPSIVEEGDRVYCITQAAHIVSCDVFTGKKIAENANDGVKSLLALKDGRLIGINNTAVVFIHPNTLSTETVMNGFEYLSNLVQDLKTGKIYFFDGTNLMQIEE